MGIDIWNNHFHGPGCDGEWERRHDRRWESVLWLDEQIARLPWWRTKARDRLMRQQREFTARLRSQTDRRFLQALVDTGGPYVSIPYGHYVIDRPIEVTGDNRVLHAEHVTIQVGAEAE